MTDDESNGEIFEPAIDLDELLDAEAQQRFRRLCMPTSSFELVELVDVVRMHLDYVQEHANPATDVEMAQQISSAFEAVFSTDRGFADDERALLRGAVEYFLLADDADGDMEDPLGFDDDVRVLNSVLARLGLDDLAIDL